MKSRFPKLAIIASLLLASVAPSGCQRQLFSENDPYNQSRIRRYWDGDSAKAARESRQRANEMGFGFATGAGTQ